MPFFTRSPQPVLTAAKRTLTLPFRPTAMLLQYLLLFSFSCALCAQYALGHAHRPALEKVGMVAVVVALSFSLSLDSPLALLIGVVVLALTQLISHALRTTHSRAKLSEMQ